jgi:hypothetical protein
MFVDVIFCDEWVFLNESPLLGECKKYGFFWGMLNLYFSAASLGLFMVSKLTYNCRSENVFDS